VECSTRLTCELYDENRITTGTEAPQKHHSNQRGNVRKRRTNTANTANRANTAGQARGRSFWNFWCSSQSGHSLRLAAVCCSPSQAALWESVQRQHRSILIAVPAFSSDQATSTPAYWLATGRARVCCCNHYSTHDHPQSTRFDASAPEATRVGAARWLGGALDLHFSITRMNAPRDLTRTSERTSSFCLSMRPRQTPNPNPTQATQQRAYNNARHIIYTWANAHAALRQPTYRCRLFGPRDTVTVTRQPVSKPQS